MSIKRPLGRICFTSFSNILCKSKYLKTSLRIHRHRTSWNSADNMPRLFEGHIQSLAAASKHTGCVAAWLCTSAHVTVLHTLLLCNLRKPSCLCRPHHHHLQPRSQISSWSTYRRPRHACSSPWDLCAFGSFKAYLKRETPGNPTQNIAWSTRLLRGCGGSWSNLCFHLCYTFVAKWWFFSLLLYIYMIYLDLLDMGRNITHMEDPGISYVYIYIYIYM